MKRFIFEAFLFIFIAIFAFYVKSFCLLCNDKYKNKVASRDVYDAIAKSNCKSKSHKVMLGDSVARQFYNNTESNDTLNSLASNQAISMAGQYVLLHNYIKAGNKIDTAYVFFRPFSFQNNLDQTFTYNYFIKTFYRKEYYNLFSEKVRQQIQKVPYWPFAGFCCIVTNNWSPEFESKDKNDFTFLSPVSVEYLHKISDFAKANHFKLILVPAITSLSDKKNVEKFDRMEITKNNLQQEFGNYFSQITYVDDSNFRDGVHLKNPEAFRYVYKNIVK